MSPLLEVTGLRVHYGGVIAVHDVSFEVEEGRTVALLGANGAGKTSTLLAISGLVTARGRIRFAGRDLLGLAPETIARMGVAHVPAGRGIFPSLTVADNLRMGLYGSGRDRTPEGRASVAAALETFPVLAERHDQPAGTMSGGQQQMLAIARALVQSPRLLLLDEMSMGLAPAVVTELFGIVAALGARGIAVLMVEQFVTQALAVADAAVVLEQGRVVAAGRPGDLAGDTVAAAYLGAAAEAGEVPPPPDHAREQLALRLPSRQVRALQRSARERGIDPASVVAEALDRMLHRGDRQP